MPETPSSQRKTTPWLEWPIGRRVTIRCHLPEGGYSDVVGEVLETSPTTVLVRTRRRGDVPVATDTIAVARLIP